MRGSGYRKVTHAKIYNDYTLFRTPYIGYRVRKRCDRTLGCRLFSSHSRHNTESCKIRPTFATHTMDTLPKAIKALRLVDRDCRLLRLPGELRELVWKFALVEPHMLDRPHRHDCEFHSSVGDGILPPALIQRGVMSAAVPVTETAKAHCQKYCGKRQGLSLLRTCRQVHSEAEGLLLRLNQFSFGQAQEIGKVFFALPTRIADQLSNLDLTELDHAEWPSSGLRLLVKLTHCKALQYLALPSHYFEYFGADWCAEMLRLPRLQKLSISVIQPVHVGNTPGTLAVHMSLSAEWRLGEIVPCARGTCSSPKWQGNGTLQGWVKIEWWCESCSNVSARMLSAIQEIRRGLSLGTHWHPFNAPGPCFAAALAHFRSLGVESCKDGLFTKAVTINQQKWRLIISGLPTVSVEEHHKSRMRAIMKNIAVRSPRRGQIIHQDVPYEDEVEHELSCTKADRRASTGKQDKAEESLAQPQSTSAARVKANGNAKMKPRDKPRKANAVEPEIEPQFHAVKVSWENVGKAKKAARKRLAQR